MEKFDKKKTLAFSNLIGAIIFLIFGIWAWIQTTTFRVVRNTVVQPSVFPRVMIIGMMIFSAFLAIQSIIKLSTMKPEDSLAQPHEHIDPVHYKEIRAALAVIVLCIFFVWGFSSLGYIITSFIVCMAIMIMIGKQDWGMMLAVSILVPLVMYILFYKILSVNIPLGPLNFIRDLLDKI